MPLAAIIAGGYFERQRRFGREYVDELEVREVAQLFETVVYAVLTGLAIGSLATGSRLLPQSASISMIAICFVFTVVDLVIKQVREFVIRDRSRRALESARQEERDRRTGLIRDLGIEERRNSALMTENNRLSAENEQWRTTQKKVLERNRELSRQLTEALLREAQLHAFDRGGPIKPADHEAANKRDVELVLEEENEDGPEIALDAH